VGDAGSELPATLHYDLRPRPPVGTFAVAAAATLIGCGLLAIDGTGNGSAVLLAVGITLLLFGLVLAGSAVLFLARLRTVIELDAWSIRIRRGPRQQVLQWPEIKNVSLEGRRLILHVNNSKGDVVVINPRTAADPSFTSLMAALSQRLDTSRGYGNTGTH